MKGSSILVLFLVVPSFIPMNTAVDDLTYQDSDVLMQFLKFIEDYERSYESMDEFYRRLEIFQENLLRFQAHNNNPQSTFTMGITPFADRRPGEVLGNLKNSKGQDIFTSRQKNFKLPLNSDAQDNQNNLEMTIDWTKQGVVPPVVDGGDLSDGVYYMVAYSIDSIHAIKQGSVELYSVQELADCTQDMQSAMEFTISKGIETTEDYNSSPGQYHYNFRTGCLYDPRKRQFHLKQWDTITAGSDIVEKMAIQLNKQPIVTIMNAESGEFLYYTGGVISEGCTSQVVLNHSLMVVGYDEEGDYWKMQNTWGTTWGEGGFVRIKRNQNVCGVESNVFFPVPY